MPGRVLGPIRQMADAAGRAGADVARLVETHDLDLAARIQRGDSALDSLHRQSFQMILDPANELSRQQVVDAVLMGRFLERFGDHSTSVARRMAYLVSGAMDLDAGLGAGANPAPASDDAGAASGPESARA